MTDVSELLQRIARRPGMYLGPEPSLWALRCFVDGVRLGLEMARETTTGSELFSIEFDRWLAARVGHPARSEEVWSTWLPRARPGETGTALITFVLEQHDEYLQQRPRDHDRG